MDIFYDKTVDIYSLDSGQPNELGIVKKELVPMITNMKAVKNPLTVAQAQQTYGLDITVSVEYTVEYDEMLDVALNNNKLLLLKDGDKYYKIESSIIYEQFYVLDANITLAVSKYDGD